MNAHFDNRSLLASSLLAESRLGVGLLCLIVLCLALTACSFLKPANPTARHFVLTPLAPGQSVAAASGSLAVGVGQVKLPAYLFNTSLAVRKSGNEIQYLDSAIWAERLDTGFQRVLAANLGSLLPTDRIQMSAWRAQDVEAELYVTIERFDVDFNGQGVLVARWRLLSPGGEKMLKAGTSRLTHHGQPLGNDIVNAITTLSDLVADLSRHLAQALRETDSVRQAVVVPR